MTDLSIFLLLAILLCSGLVWLLAPRRKRTAGAGPSTPAIPALALPLSKHYANFPKIRQALSAADAQFLAESAPPEVAKQALRERRAAVRGFLMGLREDFSSLAQLGRTIAALSPTVSHEQETERLALYVRFHLLYALVWLRLCAGNLPLHQLEHLTRLVERLASRMEEAMAEISALSAGPLSGSVRA